MERKLYNLTNPQKSIWVTEQYYTNTAVNTICGYVYISDVTNLDILEKAINECVKTNDAMRLKIKEENNSCVQYVGDYQPFEIDTVELSTEEDIEKTALKMANTPFIKDSEFLFKVILFKLPNASGGFIINVHHLIGDSWSLGLIAKDVTRIYSELLLGTYESKNAPSYLNYIETENNYKNSDKWLKDKEYWEDVFKTIPEIASIAPIKNEQKNTMSCVGKREKFTFSEEILAKIKAFCDNNKISIYNFFMAVYSLYVSRISNLDDFVMGTPILNRTTFEQKHTMGMFISVAPLRVSLNHENTFVDFAKRIATDTMSLFRHQKYSYQSILEDIRKRESSIPNLYNVVLSYQITKAVEESNQIKYTTDWVFNGNSSDELQVHLFDLNDFGSMTVAYDYKADIFDAEEITNIHNRIITIINQIMANNSILLKDIEIVTPEEKQKILYDFNNTAVDYPRNKTIVDLFEEQVEKTPNNIAVVFEDQKLTYRELNEKANYIAQKIDFINKNICILCDKSIEMIIGIIGILKSGNCYVPIDPQYPDERINFILKSTNSALLLTTDKYLETYQSLNTLTLSNISSLTNNINKSSCNSNAYIIFTSGTTGNPKGVEVLHKTIVNTLMWRRDFYKFDSHVRTLQLPSFAFDSSVEDIFTSLISGACLCIPACKINEISSLIQTVKNNNINHFLITPALYKAFLESNCDSISCLEFITVAGESFNIDLVEKHFSKFPNTRLLNEYGPTENSVCSTVYEFSKNSDIISIGRPISNVAAYIVSSNGTLLPIGVPGELWVGGRGIVKGYLNNPSLTQEKFIKNPYGEGAVYKTGDLVKWLPDGNMEFIGRIDNQVKVRGYRIELNEIDVNILNYPNIKQSVSVVQEINGSKVICSYIVAENTINIKDLKEYLSTRLTNYMVPVHIMQLDKLPLSINGKVNRKLLPMPSTERSSADIVASRNDLDKTLLYMLKELFGFEDVSIDDNLFDIGIDSLSSITLANNISNKLNKLITVKDIFEHPTVQKLSDYIATLSISNNQLTIKKASKMDYYPASSAQKRIYYASSIENNSTLYNTAGGIIVDKTLDINLLQKCFKTLIDRHEVLRTRFDIIDNDIVQTIENKIGFNLEAETAKSTDLNEIYADFVKPFDLSKAPLFRSKVVTLNNNKMLLLLDMHHIISDGTSLSILLQELCDLYNGNTLPEKNVDYKDFTLWEKEQFETEEFKKSKEFWVNQYQGEIPLLNMPTTYNRPSVQSFEGSNYHAKLSKETFDKVNEVSKKLGITPYMLMLSAYYILLSKYTSQDDIVVGTPIVGRELPELSNMLGMFVNTLALRNKIDHSSKFSDFANTIKEYCLSAFQNQAYPFDELVKELNIKRDTSRNPLVDVMFVYQNDGYPSINFNGVNTEYFIPNNNVSKFDLTLEIIPIDNELSLRFEYCTKLFDEDFIKRLASHYINILNAILENQDIKIADIDMLSKEEKNQILYEFNDLILDYPTNYNLLDLFDNVINSYPENIAVSNIVDSITYNELELKSNFLANQLSSQGVNTGDVVGVCLNRSIELLISIWAILKLGAIYMPMYIGYPADRLNYMLSDSNAKILITNSSLSYLFKKNNKIVIDSFLDIGHMDRPNVRRHVSPDNTAYIIYTSGSTGRPKGVKISHKNLVNYIYNFNTFYKKVSPADVFLASTNISFDVSIWELFMPILNGSKLILNTEEILTNIIDYCSIILSENITALYIPPNILNEVFELLKDSSGIKINKLLVGVEGIKKETLNKFFDLNNDMIIVNGYGPTETTICATALVYKKDLENTNSFVSIGRPLFNNQIYILNEALQPQPIGVPGEIYIGGFGVGNGYINNPEANKHSFIKFSNHILYKSGDLAKWNKNGTIDFIGRQDNQIKLNGYRIELNEITSVIMSYPNVNKCYTTIVKDGNNSSLVSYFTSDVNITIKDLRAYLQTKLTFYMIPKFLMQIESFPMTINGKVDYNALPKPNYKSDVPFVAPRNSFENKISKILCDLLGLNKISIDENFFDVGCDSMVAIKFQIEALKEDIDINYGDIFQYPTIRMLSENKNSSKDTTSFNLDTNYDYTHINNILIKNKANNSSNYKKIAKNTVLLLGSTGFLGAHILDNYFANNPNNTIYCIVRRKSLIDSSERLKKTLNYYFGTKYDNYFSENKIIVVEGDICSKDFGLSIEQLNILMDNIDIIINSAALVKHYGDYEMFSKINIEGTKSVIDICKNYKKKLYHISTLSVSGMELANLNTNSETSKKYIFDETSLYINQQFDNVYVYTKFIAEKNILEEIENGLNATILRIGNLTNRFSDGLFQINVSENAFVNRIKSIISLGIIQESFLQHAIELTPVDLCAEAIIKVVNVDHDFSVLHIFNNNLVECQKLLEYLNNFGYPINVVSDKEFSTHVTNYLKTDNLKNSIAGIITDLRKDKTLDYTSNIEVKSDNSNTFLNSLNYHWPILDEAYFKKYFEFFEKINYFTKNKED